MPDKYKFYVVTLSGIPVFGPAHILKCLDYASQAQVKALPAGYLDIVPVSEVKSHGSEE